MARLTCWISLVVLAVFLCHVRGRPNYGKIPDCTCRLKHPQNQVCDADFVLHVEVGYPGLSAVNSYIRWPVRVKEVFKATPEVQAVLERKPVNIWMSLSDIVCDSDGLIQGREYVIVGRMIRDKLYIFRCNLALVWTKLKPAQQNNFRQSYQSACGCEVLNYHSSSPPNNTCIWEDSSILMEQCRINYGVCIHGSEGCSWERSISYEKCMQ